MSSMLVDSFAFNVSLLREARSSFCCLNDSKRLQKNIKIYRYYLQVKFLPSQNLSTLFVL